ncbi:PDZK1-interacting protein 1-like [Acipenser oxyrinchus oxyrinchus]|uniref:PDZK1-interacting protein 1-like n=1 Tax=Acipenser oxyrinchus oxyrinchus TaxID=40147 RepID=A0AAD8DAD2_ACIOX|nr:PDZK1-interacting protein 1-like [Acipenser oxyrinchus oxyrinchus]
MQKTSVILLCLLFAVGAAVAQHGKTSPQRVLQPWLTGIIAVVVFLFLVFIAFLVNKVWCEERSEEADPQHVNVHDYVMTNGSNSEHVLDAVRSKEHEGSYENVGMDQECKVITTDKTSRL